MGSIRLKAYFIAVIYLIGYINYGVCQYEQMQIPMGPPEVVRLKELNIHSDSVKHQLAQFQESITTNTTRTLTAYDKIQNEIDVYVTGKTLSPEEILNNTVKSIEKLLKEKEDAVRELVRVAETEYMKYNFSKDVDIDYWNNKKLLSDKEVYKMKINISDPKMASRYHFIHLEEDTRFKFVPVNKTLSTVHVPTNVFDKAPIIQNGVKWSSVLDKTFVENEGKHKYLGWQYFCSSDGFLRIYPGMKWPRNNKNGNIDMYDCRVRNWYIQASTAPKNILILIDTSGSMKGLRMVIARKTVEKILDTLSDDDHFNIIKYSDEPSYVDPCFNGTMWPSNAENKELISSYIEDLEVKNIANLSKALNEAFDLFKKEEKRRNQTLCNKAIMLITDGATETHEHLFKERNWKHNKTVRVFSFLIGREVQDNKYVNWMACVNKGYYVHISSIADVQESIQHYMRVLSRPMVISRADYVVWTPLYADYSTEVDNDLKKGLQFVTSIAKPVYDKRNETFTKGNILGVMGIDVPVEHLMNLVPKDKLGANSFAFLTTRHGYVMSHPQLRPTYVKMKKSDDSFDVFEEIKVKETVLRTGYNTYDITEMTYAKDERKLKEFRRKLLKGYNKVKSLTLKIPLEDQKRIYIDDYDLYFKKLGNTGFSFGLAFPSRGLKYPVRDPKTGNGNKGFSEPAPLCPERKFFMNSNITIAPRRICDDQDLLYVPVRERNQVWYEFSKKKCPNDCLRSNLLPTDLFWAWRLTNGKKSNSLGWWHEQANKMNTGSSIYVVAGQRKPAYVTTFEKHGIQNLFCGTRSGITAFMRTSVEDNSDFIENNTRTLDDLYYQKAVMNDEKFNILYTFSIPLKTYEEGDINTTSVTATMPITSPVRGNTAVTGLNMLYTSFRDKFEDAMNRDCDPSDPTQRCFSCHNASIVSCYLLDLNGYIMYNNAEPKRIGVFLSGRDSDLMTTLVLQKIFYRVNYTDHQGVCTVSDDEEEGEGNSASFLINPFRQLASFFFWFVAELSIMLFESTVYSMSVPPSPDTLQGRSMEIEEYCSQLKRADPTLRMFMKFHASKTDRTDINCDRNYEEKSCERENEVYQADLTMLKPRPILSSIIGCEVMKDRTLHLCNRSYYVQWIENTNLIFLAAAADCNCEEKYSFDGIPPPTVQGKQITYTAEQKCKHIKQKSHEFETINFCIDRHKNETGAKCGQSGLSWTVSLLLVSIMTSRHLL